ncbi:MAG: hypothetical protein FWD15_05530 [Alphaproteobacteria bacterium]|nr:hypothetical protein [Alphaproteobacteria bacterium]
MDYRENEIKVLDVDAAALEGRLLQMGASKVYDDIRVITTYDTADRTLRRSGKLVRITEEGAVKVSMHVGRDPETRDVIKYKASRFEEQQRFLLELGFSPIAQVSARRISFELDGRDFDIDFFPGIPSFMEIDVENLSQAALDDLLEKLGVRSNKIVKLGTEEIHSLYGVDYFETYKIA